MEEKIKLTFLRVFDYPISKYLTDKRIFACNGCYGLFTQIKSGSWTNFWCTFSAWFFHKNVLYSILYQRSKFQYHNSFPSQYIQQNVLLSSYLDSWDLINFKIYVGSTSKAMADREKKRRRWKYKNLNISRRKSAF